MKQKIENHILKLHLQLKKVKNKLKENPNNHIQLRKLSTIYYKLLNDNMALKTIEKAYKLIPNDPMILFQYGACLSNMDHYNKAIHAYEKIIKMSDKQILERCNFKNNSFAKGMKIDCYAQIAEVFYNQRKWPQAITYYKKWLSKHRADIPSEYLVEDIKRDLKLVLQKPKIKP
jgi:tetratricopeptide (TPR) repeat protein